MKEIKLKITLEGGKQVTAEVEDLGDGLRELDVAAARQASASLQSFGSTLQSLGGSIRSFGQTLTLGVTLPLVALGGVITATGASYETALNTFQANTKATVQEMERAADKAKELGADLELPATSAKDAALAMNELGKAGLTANQAISASKGVLQLAAAGALNEAQAAEIAANALNAFKLEAEDTVRVADLLAAASSSSSAEVTHLAEALQQSSAVFAGAKVPIEDLITAIGLMANAGIKGSDAGTSLKTFMQRLQAPTTDAAEAMKELGVSVYDAQGRMHDLPNIINQFEKALAGLTDQGKAVALESIFGSDAIRAAQILFREGEAGFNKMKEAVTETGAAATLAAAKTKGVGGAWEAIKSQLETIGIEIFDAIKAPLERGLRTIAEILGKVGDYLSALAKSNPEIIQMGVAFLGLVAALGPVLVVLGSIISFVGVAVVAFAKLATAATAVAAAGGIFAYLGTVITGTVIPAAVALAPILLKIVAVAAVVGAAIVALGAAAYALYQAWQANFGGLQTYTLQVWEAIKTAVQTAINFIYSMVQSVGGQIVDWWQSNYPLIEQTVLTVSENIKAVIGAFLAAVQSFWESHGERIKTYASTYWNFVRQIISTVITQIGNFIRLGLQIINGDWSGAWQTILTTIQTGTKLATTIFTGFLDTLGRLLHAMIPIVVEYGVRFSLTLQKYVAQAVAGVVYLLATLPQQIIRLVPIFIRAGMSIAAAIWEGIKEGLKGASTADGGLTVDFLGVGGSANLAATAAEAANAVNNATTAVNKFGDTAGKSGKKTKEILTPLQELQKEAKKAREELDFLSNSPLAQSLKVETANLQDQKSKIEELLKLRNRLGINEKQPLPSNIGDLNLEIDALNQQEEGWRRANDMLRDYKNNLAGIGKEATELEKVNNLLKDETRTVLIEAETAAQLRQNAARVDARKRAEELTKAKDDLIKAGFNERLQLSEAIKLTGAELQLGRELSAVEKQSIQNRTELLKAEQEWTAAGKTRNEIEELRNILLREQADTLKLLNTLEGERAKLDAQRKYKDLLEQLNEQLLEGVKISEQMRVAKLLETEAYKNLTEEQRASLLLKAQEVDAYKAHREAVKELTEQWHELKETIHETLDYLFKGDIKGMFKNIFDRIKDNFLENLSATIASKILGFDPRNESNNPIAKPIVGKINESNDLLRQIVTNTGGNSPFPGVAGSAGISLGGGSPRGVMGTITGILGSIFGGRNGGRLGTPPFNPNAGMFFGGLDGGHGSSAGPGGGSIWSRIFGAGGIFGEKGFGNNVGTFSAIGAGASLLGNLLGGRVGRTISMAGAGLGLGATIGSIVPGIGTAIGAAVGAVAGGLIGLFTNPQRREDEKTRTAAYQAAVQEMDKLIIQLKAIPPRIDSIQAQIRGNEIIQQYNQIASGLKDSKTRRIALGEVTNTNGIIYKKNLELQAAIQQAQHYEEMRRKNQGLVGEFAGGVYMDSSFQAQYDDFKRYNGLMPGAYTGRDYIKALIGDGEMILNTAQQMRVIANSRAGSDNPFKGAGIPNYQPAPEPTVPKFATGASFNSSSPAASNQSEPIVISIEKVIIDAEGIVFEGLKSSTNQKVVFKSVKEISNNRGRTS